MALIALASAGGSPGVTTTALALALQWPRPALLIEADLAGGTVLPGFFRGQLAQGRGLSSLAIEHSEGRLEERMWDHTIELQQGEDNKRLMPGISGPHGAPALRTMWGPLASYSASLESAEIDVLVDLGRMGGPGDEREALISRADLVLIAVRPTLPGIARAFQLIQQRIHGMDRTAVAMSNLGLLVIEDKSAGYTPAEIAHTTGIGALSSIAFDSRSAEVLSLGTSAGPWFLKAQLFRSVAALVDTASTRVLSRRQLLSNSLEVVK